MIGRLKGTVEYLGEDHVIVDVNGVGYRVAASARNMARMRRQEAVALWIETVVREDSVTLYGFMDRQEQAWFLILTGVQGVGAKLALSILGTLGPDDLALALAAGDRASLNKVSGVGPKLALRLVTELKGKRCGGFASPDDSAADAAETTGGGLLDDTVSALANLGYQRMDALKAAGVALKGNPKAALNELIVLALKEMGK